MTRTLRVEVPRKLRPLLSPSRYKGAHGGRGGAKSHFYAEQMIVRCLQQPTRAVCIREVQNSIKDSVRQLLIDKIAKFGLEGTFEVLDNEVRGPNGSLIIFKGMQSYNADNIKSLEAYDIAWVEEAQTLSQHSLDMLRPTIRKEGSELWFSWNPRYKTDPVDVFFRKQRRDNAVCVEVNWRDNPWFPDVLRKEMLDDFEADEDKAEHIWNGAYGFTKGSILGKWVNRARRYDRIGGSVPFDPAGAPIEISSDIGFHDTACWWFWQRRVGGYALIGYMGASGFDADDWCQEIDDYLEGKGIGAKKLGKIWLPHDSRAKTFQSKHSSVERFIHHYGAGNIGIVPVSRKADQISAARLVIANCAFDTSCEEGVDGLEAWEYEFNEETQEFSREPVHNWASHPADAFAYGCQVMQGLAPPPKVSDLPRHTEVGPGNSLTLEDAWGTRYQGGGGRI